MTYSIKISLSFPQNMNPQTKQVKVSTFLCSAVCAGVGQKQQNFGLFLTVTNNIIKTLGFELANSVFD